MTSDIEALARRAVACRGWRWMPGMLASDTGLRYDEFILGDDWEGEIPDLDDPSVTGCLLALVREALGDRVWLPTCIDAEGEAWVVDSPSQNRQTRHESYAAALVAALEAAP